jgi:hypothetical protein
MKMIQIPFINQEKKEIYMTDSELQQAIDAIKSGKRDRGQALLTNVLKLDPQNEIAWQWLSVCQNNDENKIYCLKKALEINPANSRTKDALDKLVAKNQNKIETPSLDLLTSQNYQSVPQNSSNGVNQDKSSQFPWIPISIGIVILVVVLGLGGYIILSKNSNSSQISQLLPKSPQVTKCNQSYIDRLKNMKPSSDSSLLDSSGGIWKAMRGCNDSLSCNGGDWVIGEGDSGCTVDYIVSVNGASEVIHMFYIDTTTDMVYGSDDAFNLGVPNLAVSALKEGPTKNKIP